MKPRRFAAPLLAFLGTGLGHFTVGRFRRGILWLSADVMSGIVVTLVLRAMPALLWPAVGFLFLFRIASIVDVARLPAADPERLPGWGLVVGLWFVILIVGGAEATVVRAKLLEAYKIPAGSMSPTLLVGDHILVDKHDRAPARGKVMVFRYPKDPSEDFVKRVIAVGGDTVELRDGAVLVNGQEIARRPTGGDCRYPDWDDGENQLVDHPCDGWEETIDGSSHSIIFGKSPVPTRTWPPVTVPPHQFYVLGDNRDNSHDSRYWGFVPNENVKGRALSIWWSSDGKKTRWDRVGRPVR